MQLLQPALHSAAAAHTRLQTKTYPYLMTCICWAVQMVCISADGTQRLVLRCRVSPKAAAGKCMRRECNATQQPGNARNYITYGCSQLAHTHAMQVGVSLEFHAVSVLTPRCEAGVCVHTADRLH
jgi:hypothetical protein